MSLSLAMVLSGIEAEQWISGGFKTLYNQAVNLAQPNRRNGCFRKQRRKTKYNRKINKKQTPNEGVLQLLHLYELFDLLNNNVPDKGFSIINETKSNIFKMKGRQQYSQKKEELAIVCENEAPSETIGEPKCAETKEETSKASKPPNRNRRSANKIDTKPEETNDRNVAKNLFDGLFVPSNASCDNYNLPVYSQHENEPRSPQNTERHNFGRRIWEKFSGSETGGAASSYAYDSPVETDYFKLFSNEKIETHKSEPKRQEEPDAPNAFSYFQNNTFHMREEHEPKKLSIREHNSSALCVTGETIFNKSYVDVLRCSTNKTKAATPKKESTVTYENRNVLDLFSNLRGSFYSASADTSNGLTSCYANSSQNARLLGMYPPPHRDVECKWCGFVVPRYPPAQ